MKNGTFSIGVIFVLSFVSSVSTLYAQKKNSVKGIHNFSIGYTYKTDANWWRGIFDDLQFTYPKRTNDVVVKYEFGISKKITVGLEAGFIDDESENFNSLFGTYPGNYSYSIAATRLSTLFNYHFFVSSHLDCYANLGIGYYAARIKVLQTYPDPNPLNTLGWIGSTGITEVERNEKRRGIDFSAGLGVRYFFHKNVGLFSEAGFNKSVFQTGIVFKIN